MHLPSGLLALPASLLLLIANAPIPITSHELEWPYNLPAHIMYFPEDEVLIKRDASLRKMLQQNSPVGVKKMSSNPDEKFFLDYWILNGEDIDHNFDLWTNASSLHSLRACSALHHEIVSPKFFPRNPGSPLVGRSLFEKRDFKCPVNTEACTSIGYPDSCCATGSTCQIIENTGFGSVGCCPEGEICAGGISSCPADYTSCPQGGGCCIPGYSCFDVGCVQTATETVYVSATPSTVQDLISTTTITLTTITTPSAAPPTTRTSTTIVVVTVSPPSVSTSSYPLLSTISSTSSIAPLSSSTTSTTTTKIILPTGLSTTSVRTTTTTSYTTSVIPTTCSSGFKSCAASLGGGCCPTDRACGSGYCPALSTTGTVSPPYRPTTESTTTTSSISTISGAICPTGFYACSAYYQGGCCQVGRDCAKTNCPASASTTLVSGSGITIVAPTGSGISTQILTGSCANGWFSCAAGYGGGCCPSGYACGTSCTATATGANGAQVGKEAPQSGASRWKGRRSIWRIGMSCMGIAIGVALL